MVPKRILCRLEQIMADRGLNQQDLATLAGVDPERIRKLCNGEWQAVARTTLGKLCSALNVRVDALFEAVPSDIWFPIRRHRAITVHLGSTSLESRTMGIGQGGAFVDRQGVGTWDVRSLFHVYESHLRATVGPIELTYAEHIEDHHDPAAVAQLFTAGNHLIFGSPLVNPIAEDVVCRAYDVPARQRQSATTLPFRFRWDRPKESALGEFGGSSEPGIVARGRKDLVARRTVIAAGEDGEDCGLIFTYRYNPAASRAEDDDFIIVAVMGHSGCGTLGGTKLVCTSHAADALYPNQRDKPILRAFRTTYRRPTTSRGFDNREPIESSLV